MLTSYRSIPIVLADAVAPRARASGATGRRWRALPPLTLYVHVPWCLRKCPYCDFNSHELRGAPNPPEIIYVNALLADLEQAIPSIWGRRVHAIFVGGGTPSLF